MSEDLGSFLARLDPAVRRIFIKTHALVRRAIPKPVESFDGQYLGVGVGEGYKGMIFAVSAHGAHVTLGIYNGVQLADPDGLLEGKGKRHRHVKIRDAGQLTDPALARLIAPAVENKAHDR
jgi:hypothetical protein